MYTQSITRSHRTAFVLLIDGSGSMAEEILFRGKRTTKAEAVALITNGLLFELMGGSVRNDSMVVVANAVEEFLDSLSQRFSLVPAGTNVDFDLDFLRRLNLNPDAWLTYRKYDMATIRRLVTVLGAPDPYQGDSGQHRVKSCIARDIKDYKAMLETLAVKTGDHK